MRTVILIIWVVVTTVVGSLAALFLSPFRWGPAVNHLISRLWARGILFVSGVEVTVEGLHNLIRDRGIIYMANHQSMFDILVLFAHLPVQFRWLAKKELFQIPLFGPALTRAGHICIDRSDRRAAHRSLLNAAGKIASGVSVIIFPEGSRSPDDQLKPFKPGGFHLAMRSRQPIIPVTIYGTHQVLPKESLDIKPGRVIVSVNSPVPTASYGGRDKPLLMGRIKKIMQQDLTRIKANWALP